MYFDFSLGTTRCGPSTLSSCSAVGDRGRFLNLFNQLIEYLHQDHRL
jgi:hypothetical protein